MDGERTIAFFGLLLCAVIFPVVIAMFLHAHDIITITLP